MLTDKSLVILADLYCFLDAGVSTARIGTLIRGASYDESIDPLVSSGLVSVSKHANQKNKFYRLTERGEEKARALMGVLRQP